MHHDAALILVGHGSTLNPDSSAPTYRHADELRRRGLFAEVHCAFWKEEPSLREVTSMVRSRTAYIVPLFISEGYFCQQVIPRELRLDGPVTRRDGKTFFYCNPVGIHPGMTRLLLKRAGEAAPGVPRSETCLIIVGHGTGLNENSRRAIETQVGLIRSADHGFAQVLDAYMEEAPFIAQWHTLTSAPNVVVVPFFIADGLHSYQDIPVLLGMEAEPGAAASQREVFRHNPHLLQGRHLYYSSAIGTEELMADVVLDQVRDFDEAHRIQPDLSGSSPAQKALRLPAEGFVIGQVRASPRSDGRWTLCHAEDAVAAAASPELHRPEAARDIAAFDDAGQFRALKSAPDLRHGWQLNLEDEDAVRLALDFLYPGALSFINHWQAGTLNPVSLRETLGRQSGMYRFANTIRDDQAHDMVACECAAGTKCLRRILWQLDEAQPLSRLTPEKLPPTRPAPGVLPLLCIEACTHLVNAARTIAQRNHRESEAAGNA